MRKRLTDAQIKKIRKELISLYGRRCLKCGSKGQMSFVHAPRMFTKIRKELCVDHILPLSKGGSNEISNFQLLCHGCNISKKQKSTDYRPIKGANMTEMECKSEAKKIILLSESHAELLRTLKCLRDRHGNEMTFDEYLELCRTIEQAGG